MDAIKKIILPLLVVFALCGCGSKTQEKAKEDFASQMTMKGYEIEEMNSMGFPLIDDGVLQEGDDGYEELVQEPIEHIEKIYVAKKNDDSGFHIVYYVTFDDNLYADTIFRKVGTKYITLIQRNDHVSNITKEFDDSMRFSTIVYAFDEEMAKEYGSYCAGVAVNAKNKAVCFYFLQPEEGTEISVSKLTPEKQVDAVVKGIKEFGFSELTKIK